MSILRKSFVLLALLLVALCGATPARADWTFHRHDCASFGDWASTNAQTMVAVGKLVVPIVAGPSIEVLGQKVGLSQTMIPWSHGEADVGWTGLATGVLGAVVSLGVSPAGIANTVLHLFCVEVADVGPVPSSPLVDVAGAQP